MPHRGLARSPRHCSWHSFWSSPIASGTRARAGRWTCVRDLLRVSLRLSRPAASRHITSRPAVSFVCSIRVYVSPSRHARCTCTVIDPEGKVRRRYRYFLPREKNAAENLLQMLFPENGDNFQRSMRYRTSRDFPDPDLHSEYRMENDNHRHPGQDGRKDYLRDQPLHDHPDLYAAHNRRFKEKYIYDASVGGSGHYASRLPSCERPLHLDYVFRKQRGS